MIDIRDVAKAIAGLTIENPAARQAAIHGHLREYGVQLLTNLHNAIQPTTEAEIEVVHWLRNEIAKIVQQIPSPISKKDPAP